MKLSRSSCMLMTGLLLTTFVHAETIQLVTGNYPPYEYEEDGQVRGLAIDVLTEAFRRCNQTISIKVVPWARALLEAQEGGADGIFSAVKTPEREQIFSYSKEAIIPLVVSLFVRKDSLLRYDGDISKLSDYRFGIVNQFSNGPIFDGAVKSGILKKIDQVSDTDTNIKKLMAGRIDVMVNNKFGAIFFLKKNKVLDQVIELSPEIDNSPSYLAFTKKRDMTKVRRAYDAALAAMKRDGTYQRILDRYGR